MSKLLKTRAYLPRADVKRVLGVTTWPQEADWQKNPLLNPTKVKLPLSNLEVFRATFVPLVIMIVIRPVLLVSMVLLTGAIGYGF